MRLTHEQIDEQIQLGWERIRAEHKGRERKPDYRLTFLGVFIVAVWLFLAWTFLFGL